MTDYGFWRKIAYFRSTWLWQTPSEPLVYHRNRGGGIHQRGEQNCTLSVCGLSLDSWNRETGHDYRRAVAMRVELAEKIARPCERCWP